MRISWTSNRIARRPFAKLRRVIGIALLGIWMLSGGRVFGQTLQDPGKPQDSGTPQSLKDEMFADQPVFYLDFSDTDGSARLGDGHGSSLAKFSPAHIAGQLTTTELAPRPPIYPHVDSDNVATWLNGSTYLAYDDPGDSSPLDFDAGDAITIEAWVKPTVSGEGRFAYIVGKGRTQRDGFPRDNQNYALRLTVAGGQLKLSFLFRNAQNRSGQHNDYHRWTSSLGFAQDDHWHHVAVSYRFGHGDSVRGYVDGEPTGGTWDMGGATDQAPVVDDDQLWVGSAIGGNPASSFVGGLDEVAIYRSQLSKQRIARRYQSTLPQKSWSPLAAGELPAHAVTVEIFEGINEDARWPDQVGGVADRYEQPWMAWVRLPRKYNSDAIIADRTNAYLMRARGFIELPAGKSVVLLRAKNASRLKIDGQLIAETDFMERNASGHEAVPQLVEPLFTNMQPLAAGHQERLVEIERAESGRVLIEFETIVGGKGLRKELGEACVAIGPSPERVSLVCCDSSEPIAMDFESWQGFRQQHAHWITLVDQQTRRERDTVNREYWQQRHAYARDMAGRRAVSLPDKPSEEWAEVNPVDRYINSAISAAGLKPADPVDDLSFLRRVTLDTVGVIPTFAEVESFLSEPADVRRTNAIERLLEDPRWADHWVSYWQDVLAENPGILKPELNNTGPFRYWIYESFLDNKPMDRFATELIEMRGSVFAGGPAGFARATQNDVPMAAKALVISQAFLGQQMMCARCHDSPVRDVSQEELFSLAAMLNRQPISLPATSTVPLSADGHQPAVTSSLKPGARIDPRWPYDQLSNAELEPARVRRPGDSRSELAYFVTGPENERFPQVIVNRLWQRLFGVGLVGSADDWETASTMHPELLRYLALELTSHGYDLKHVARLLLNSATYQRQIDTTGMLDARWFAARVRRRMTAEQLVDSLYVAAGKSFAAEMLTLDPEGRRPANTFLNLGYPRRAWEFTSLSNERDRPALALPVAQSVIDLLVNYGWRDSRSHGITDRDQDAQLLQPLTIANGTAVHRLSQLSDNGELVELCLQAEGPEVLVDQMFLRVLSRRPGLDERRRVLELVAPGFESRKTGLPRETAPTVERLRSNVSWSNHLSAEATEIKQALELAARQGDPPSRRLDADWRERAEDLVWALLNSPEFQFVP